MEEQGGKRICGEKRAPGESGVANKKRRTEDCSSVGQLQHTNSSDGQDSETGSQLVLHNRDGPLTFCGEYSTEIQYLMVQNICKKCTAISSDSGQPERIIHIIFEKEATRNIFMQPLFACGFIQVDKLRDTYYFAAAKKCIVTASWLHDVDHENDVHGFFAGLKQLSNNRESSAVVLLSGKANNRGIESGQVVPIGSLSFSSDASRTLLNGCPTFNTHFNDHLNKLLQDQTKPDVLYKNQPSAVCIDTSKDVPLNKKYMYSVVIDKHPIFLRKLLEHFSGDALCVMVAIDEHMEQNGAVDRKAMQNAITLLHTFLAAGIDTVFTEVRPIITTCDLVRRVPTETLCNQPINSAHINIPINSAHAKPPINSAHTNPPIKFPNGTTYQLPETPDSQRLSTTKDIPPSVEPALDSSKTLTDILLLVVAKKLLASDAIDLGVALGLERRKAKNLVNTCGQQSDAAAVQEVLHGWKDAFGRDATPKKLIDALRLIEKTDVADLVLTRVTTCI
ncbi:uncharacterized protein [Branchiostoma lanceolatum]|uniref:uncharacterized protein n=1 Tax=Branchiostoma lanceolatum TaxID=7740 RepID=UPI0034528CE1